MAAAARTPNTAAEASAVNTPAQPPASRRKPAAVKAPVARRAAGAAKPAAKKTRATKPPARKPRLVAESAAQPTDVEVSRRRVLVPVLARTGAVVAAAAAAVFLLVGGDEPPAPSRPGGPVVLSAEELSSFVESQRLVVSWAGDLSSRRLELTTTGEGTFLRYLPRDASAGDDRPVLTVATYPLADAYATAVGRSRSERMTSRRAADGAIAVWSLDQPTSVYLAWRGSPTLVEVYAPTPAEARQTALSGRVRPVR